MSFVADPASIGTRRRVPEEVTHRGSLIRHLTDLVRRIVRMGHEAQSGSLVVTHDAPVGSGGKRIS